MDKKNQKVLKKNEKYIVSIIDFGSNGEGVAKIDDCVVFVPFSIVGEKVEIQIIKTTNKFCVGKILKIIEPSKNRVNAPCPYFGKCGGCQLQHMTYSSQLKYKTTLVSNSLKKYAKIEACVGDCVGSGDEYHYRNKFAFPVFQKDGKICVGMYRANSHDGIEIDDCLIQKECKYIIESFLEFAKKYNIHAYSQENTAGIKHIIARICGKNLLFAIVSGKKLQNIELLYEKLCKKYAIVSLVNNINTKNNNVILGDKDFICSGTGELEYSEFGIEYTVGVHSFLQVNDDIKRKLYSSILNNISAGDIVVDAYSGAGLLSAMISKKCKKVYAIEIVKDAVESAKKLCNINKIKSVENILGDCSAQLPKVLKRAKVTTLVLDPPRKGCDEKVLNEVLDSCVQKIIYVSCNPATLARDLAILSKNYEVKTVQPFDMFPQTANVETFVVLNKI